MIDHFKPALKAYLNWYEVVNLETLCEFFGIKQDVGNSFYRRLKKHWEDKHGIS